MLYDFRVLPGAYLLKHLKNSTLKCLFFSPLKQVNTLHTEMVKWMVQLLLRLAPDQASHSQESKEAVLEGTTSLAQLVANAKSLFHRLAGFSKYVTM